ncbi:MAG TPA: serine hydrolase domain-containing protein [Anaerohalosphaeraceae bacterium]|nr:serine hydrolase domain-containing protein [Anaerohalosphaeraceae bacterium]
MTYTIRVAAASIGLGILAGCYEIAPTEVPVSIQQAESTQTPPSDLSQIDTLVQGEIAQGHFPGAVVLVGQGDKTLYYKAFGNSVSQPFQEPMQQDTVFDIASLSKPVGTATSVLILVEQGKIHLEDEVAKYLPAFACSGKEKVQIKHLLSHTSGLPAYTDAAAISSEFGPVCPDKVLDKICSLKALNEPGATFRYSCLGYITLGRIVEIVSDQPLDAFARDNIFVPLGMTSTRYNPPPLWRERIAAATLQGDVLLRGNVHDPLAALMGGVSGNAGIFSTAQDLAAFCRMLLNDGQGNGPRILGSESVTLLTSEQALGRAYGFDVSSSYAGMKGDYPNPKAFCHSGYTGTSIVCDPDAKVFIIILTNRVHPDDKGSVGSLRKEIATIVGRWVSRQENEGIQN